MNNLDPKVSKDKYIVLKKSDYDRIVNGTRVTTRVDQVISELKDAQLSDCWVVRKHDMHAAPSVFAYAQSAQNSLEFMAMVTEANNEAFEPRVIENVSRARDAAQEFALDALAMRTKRLPS